MVSADKAQLAKIIKSAKETSVSAFDDAPFQVVKVGDMSVPVYIAPGLSALSAVQTTNLISECAKHGVLIHIQSD